MRIHDQRRRAWAVPATTVCQLTMRHFKDGAGTDLEPWRARAFPLMKDLVVDRRAFDRIIAAGGYISVSTGSAPDGNAIPVAKESRTVPWMRRPVSGAEPAWRLARTRRPRCSPGRRSRIWDCCRKGSRSVRHERCAWWRKWNAESFGTLHNIGECTAVCPKEIPLEVIGRMNRDFNKGILTERPAATEAGAA